MHAFFIEIIAGDDASGCETRTYRSVTVELGIGGLVLAFIFGVVKSTYDAKERFYDFTDVSREMKAHAKAEAIADAVATAKATAAATRPIFPK